MWWTEGQLKIAALKIAPPAGFSPQIHLLDTFSWGNGACDESAGWILRRNSPEILIVPQCETPGTRAGGPHTPGHLPQLSPGLAIRGRRAVVLPGAGLGSVSHADRIQAESMGFGCWPEGLCEMVDDGQTSEPPSFSWGALSCCETSLFCLTTAPPSTHPGTETPQPPGCQVGPS